MSPFLYFIGMRCRVPKSTFISVVDLPKDSSYVEKYIKVAWCLYPHVPKKVEKLYVQIPSRFGNDRRYFEILNHKTCQCRGLSNSTAGYEELRKANIRELVNKPNNGKLTSPRKHINRMKCLYIPYRPVILFVHRYLYLRNCLYSWESGRNCLDGKFFIKWNFSNFALSGRDEKGKRRINLRNKQTLRSTKASNLINWQFSIKKKIMIYKNYIVEWMNK